MIDQSFVVAISSLAKVTTPVDAMRKLVRVFLDHGIEALDFGLQVSTREPKENDACMEEPLVEDQLTEIAVGNQLITKIYSSRVPCGVSA